MFFNVYDRFMKGAGKKMNSALLAGYYGMDNTGDDCLLAVTAWGANTLLHPERLFATAGRIPVFRDSRSVLPVHACGLALKGYNRLSEWSASLRSRTVVFGGGSVFNSIRDMRRKMELLRLSGKGPHFAIGVSLGPFSDTKAEKYCKELLKRLFFAGMRDQESMDIVKSWSADINAVKTFDLAPLLPRTNGLSLDDVGRADGRKGIGIAMCDYESFVSGDPGREKVRRTKMIETIRALTKSVTEEIVMIDFNGHKEYGDASIHEDIAQGIQPGVRLRRVKYNGDPLSVMREIGQLRLMIAMRLHAAIFSYITDTPAILLSYHRKCAGWASEIGLDGKYVLDSSGFDVRRLTHLIMEVLDGTVVRPGLARGEAERLAMLNFAVFDLAKR